MRKSRLVANIFVIGGDGGGFGEVRDCLFLGLVDAVGIGKETVNHSR